MGILVKDQAGLITRTGTKGDMEIELAQWIVEHLSKEKRFTKILNLNASRDKTKEVDLILRCSIEHLHIEEPGISPIAWGLSFFYGVAPIFQHYVIPVTIVSTVKMRFQLIRLLDRQVLWEKQIEEMYKEKTQMAKKEKNR